MSRTKRPHPHEYPALPEAHGLAWLTADSGLMDHAVTLGNEGRPVADRPANGGGQTSLGGRHRTLPGTDMPDAL